LDQITDSAWAERVKKGDQAAFKLLFRRHIGWVYNKAYRMLKNHEDAEEVCQDIFTKVWLKIDLWDPRQGSFQTWLNEIAKNTIIDALRKRKRRGREKVARWLDEEKKETILDLMPDPHPTPDKEVEDREAYELIEEALLEVRREDHRIAWTLRHIEGLSISEIAKAMDEKENTIKVWIFRCSNELRRLLRAKGIEL
jgi:RNA polymerase sigma-70 factor (ECF subfamily)